MKILKSLQELDTLDSCLPHKTLRKYLDHEFRTIHSTLAADEPIESFTLEDHGYLVLLEPEDDVRDLSQIGLPPASAGLFDVIPEFVVKDTLPDNTSVYRVGVLGRAGTGRLR